MNTLHEYPPRPTSILNPTFPKRAIMGQGWRPRVAQSTQDEAAHDRREGEGVQGAAAANKGEGHATRQHAAWNAEEDLRGGNARLTHAQHRH